MLRISCSICRNTNATLENGEWKYLDPLNSCCKDAMEEIKLLAQPTINHGNDVHNNEDSDEPSFYDWEMLR
jgi:hypothetical protein